MFLKKLKNIFCLTHAKNVGREMFLEVAKQSNSRTFYLTSKFQMLDQECLIVWPGPYDSLIANLKFQNCNKQWKHFQHTKFRIIGRAGSLFHLSHFESVHIKTKRPVLCRRKELVFSVELFNGFFIGHLTESPKLSGVLKTMPIHFFF